MVEGIPETARCLGCGYALRELTLPRCPECGRGFDPRDERTFAGEAIRPWLRLMARPPSFLHVAFAIALTSAILYGRSLPAAAYDPLAPSLPVCGAAAALPVWIFWYLLRMATTSRASIEGSIRGDELLRRRRWLVTPTCLVLIVLMFCGDWPLRMRFGLSKWAFEREARQALLASGGSAYLTTLGPRLVGLYHVDQIEIYGNRVDFYVGSSVVDSVGFTFDAQPGATITPTGQLAGTWDTFED